MKKKRSSAGEKRPGKSKWKNLFFAIDEAKKKKVFSVLKKTLLVGVILCVLGAVACFTVSGAVRLRTEDKIITEETAAYLGDVDCILILGCGVWDTEPSPMLNDRLKVGISLYEAGVSDRLLMSGDHGRENYDEVNVMKRVAVETGIDPDAVFCDHAGFSTYESMYRAREIFGAKKIVIVTQSYHLYRALYVAEKLGLEAYGVSADLRAYGGQTYRDLREVAARTKDFFYTLIQPEPTYLGDKIDLNGPGSATDG